jgi:protein-S-isoprenylcysteine O-methyltransferase Ste14
VTLADQIHAQGRRLFASRSTMPLLLLPFVLLALPDSWDMEVRLGRNGSAALQWLALLVSFSGLLLRCMTVAFAPDGTSSRDTRGLRAPSLNTTGSYSVVRHPLYLGAGLMWIGVAMSLRVWWLVVIVALAYWLYIERVALAEEAFLLKTFPEQFRQWAANTPAFIPRWSGWRSSNGSFQGKRLLSEHNGLLGVSLSFVLLQFLEDRQHGGQTWAGWYAHHSDLVHLTEFAMVVSAICILIRRSRWMRDSSTDALPTIARS